MAIEALVYTRRALRVWRNFSCANGHVDDTAGARGDVEGLKAIEGGKELGEGEGHFEATKTT
jgi:hypothetical protein